jgi:hypothetical protein
MNDEAVSPDQQARNRRLFSGVIGWLLSQGRRPGMTGAAVAFRGRMDGASVSMTRVNDAWDLASPTRQERVGTAEFIRLVGTGQFFPRMVEIEPDLAELLFKETIHQADVSMARLHDADPHIEALAGSYDLAANLVPWVMSGALLDQSVQASIASIVLSIAACEAQVNHWAEALGGWSDGEDRGGVAEKCRVLATRTGHVIDLGANPYQGLQKSVKRRDSLVHSKPVPEAFPATGAQALIPGQSLLVEARTACMAVRASLIDLSHLTNMPTPHYLAYCPPGAPDDDEAWRSAIMLTGTRLDPDFPPRSSE